ncbi:hypothetical protein Aduo_001841 [Ancylostoma duodenale]
MGAATSNHKSTREKNAERDSSSTMSIKKTHTMTCLCSKKYRKTVHFFRQFLEVARASVPICVASLDWSFCPADAHRCAPFDGASGQRSGCACDREICCACARASDFACGSAPLTYCDDGHDFCCVCAPVIDSAFDRLSDFVSDP